MYVEGDNTGRPTGSSPQNEAETSGYSSRVEAETSGYSSRVDPEGGFDHEEDDYQNNPPFYDNIWELFDDVTSRDITRWCYVTFYVPFLTVFWRKVIFENTWLVYFIEDNVSCSVRSDSELNCLQFLENLHIGAVLVSAIYFEYG